MTARPSLIVDTGDPTPAYEQLRRQFTRLIQSSVLAPGERLPPLRQLAADLGLAVGTVARAYRELEAAGLVTSRRGGGTRVADRVPALAGHERHRLLLEQANDFVRQAILLGGDEQEILHAVSQALAAGTGGPEMGLQAPAMPSVACSPADGPRAWRAGSHDAAR